MDTEKLNSEQKAILLSVARQSIHEGVIHGHPLKVDANEYSAPLNYERASFVTLHINQQLRGCIGSLEAYRPLVQDIAENAFNAAFRDPRFSALSAPEEPLLHIHISVLSETSPIQFKDEADLLEQIRPGIDGLVLEDSFHRGTFLPSVWEQLPTKKAFLSHLKQKAGLPSDYWSDNIKIGRYTVDDTRL